MFCLFRHKKRRIVIHIPVKVHSKKRAPPPPQIQTVVKEVHHHHKPSIIKEQKFIKQEIHTKPHSLSTSSLLTPYEKFKEEIEHEHVHHHYKHEHPSFEEIGGLGSSSTSHVNSVFASGKNKTR